MKLFAVSVCVLSLAGFVCGQDLDPLGSGKVASYTIQDLPNDLVAVELSTSRDNLRSLFQLSMYSAPYSAQNANPPALTPEMIMQLEQVLWVPKSEALHGGEMLVGYKFDPMRFPVRGDNNVDVSSIRFRLTYVRRDSIISITPRAEFSPASIKEMAQTKVPPSGTTADRTATLSNMKQIGTALMILLSDYDDFFPYVQGTPQLFKFMEPYTKNTELFKTRNPLGGTFRFNMSLGGVSSTEIAAPAETPMFYESEAWPDGKRCVCYADTHAKYVTAEEWTKMQPLLKLNLKRHGKPIPLNAKTLPDPPKVK